MNPHRIVHTFSLVARSQGGDLGIAVASKFLAVGAVVPFAKAGVGAVATQAHANTAYGPDGLTLLAQGLSPSAVIERFKAEDPGHEARQVGIVAANGESATYTGPNCLDWAGGRAIEGAAAQGNILHGPGVIDALLDRYDDGGLAFPYLLLDALSAGDEAGGDRRGRQSAALLIVREGAGYGGKSDRYIDLRVDDHEKPIPELTRILHLHLLLFGRPESGDVHYLSETDVRTVQEALRRLGHYKGEVSGAFDGATQEALTAFHSEENFEHRLVDGVRIDRDVFSHLRRKAGL